MFKNASPNPSFEEVLDVEPNEVFSHSSEIQIVDVREPDEFNGELGHIAGAKLIPLSSVPDRASEIDPHKITVLVCRSGGRSGRATAFLIEEGYKSVYNMKGGMIQWNQLQLKVERK